MSKPAPTRFRTLNWSAYNASLCERGSLTVWFDPSTPWHAAPSGKRGGQLVYGDAAIQACLTIKVLFGLPLRQTTGFVASLLKLAGLDWPVPNSSTLCRRQRTLAVQLPYRGSGGSLHLLVDNLVNKMDAEARAGRQGRIADHLCRLDFVVFDELGYLPFAQSGGQLLFHLVSKLYERTSVIVTTNLASLRPNCADAVRSVESHGRRGASAAVATNLGGQVALMKKDTLANPGLPGLGTLGIEPRSFGAEHAVGQHKTCQRPARAGRTPRPPRSLAAARATSFGPKAQDAGRSVG